MGNNISRENPGSREDRKGNRRNQGPIFIVAFTRGGSNILFNLLRSHPDVVTTRGEMQQIFLGKPEESRTTVLRKRLAYLPIALAERRHILRTADWTERPTLGGLAAKWLDEALWRDRFLARAADENRYRDEGVEYTRAEIARARVLIKNVDGLIFLSRALATLYPDATFIGLVRNGYAVCEGHVRRGASLAHAAERYRRGMARMIEDAEHLPRFHLCRYEDLIDPDKDTFGEILHHCGLDRDRLHKIRLETKHVIDASGEHRNFQNAGGGKESRWYEPGEHFAHFVPEANRNQIERLDATQIATIREQCSEVLDRFGYGPAA